jgi:DNA topoisomerase-1
MKTVIVVESPAKAKKISSFFKDGTIVTSSFGHIIDLPKDKISIDIENNFKPTYKTMPGKSKIVSSLRNYNKGYRVLLAADDDREGDAIAWHCGKTMNVDFKEKNRIIFHEISKRAIQESIQNVHQLNMNSVNAQQGRRVLDRLVGYSLSPLLWKHIQTDKLGLSAGRVQSTLLLILKQHEDNINEHISESDYKYCGNFTDSLKCDLILKDCNTLPNDILTILKNDKDYKIEKQEHKEEKKYSPFPLITSSLQRCAQGELKFTVKKTMNIAQKLYENGKITYMRTDSTNISSDFQAILCNHIKDNYGKEYYLPKNSNKKVKGAQEAHECIRVTSLDYKPNDNYSEDDKRLYELIKKYTIISHMKYALYDNHSILLNNDTLSHKGYFMGNIKSLLFDGYLRYTNDKLEIVKEIRDIPLKIYRLKTCNCEQVFSNPPGYLNESSIVKKLETSGIGRPSTYASLISTLYNRNYTEVKNIKGLTKEVKTYTLNTKNEITEKTIHKKLPDQKFRIILTDLGKLVLEYLMNHFSMIINIEFTSLVEKDLDRVASGEIEWQTVVGKVYDSFKDTLNVQKSLKSKKINKSGKNSNPERVLGEYKDIPVVLKDGRYGPYISYKDKNYTLQYLLKDKEIEYDSIRLELVLDTIKYPLCLGKHKGSPVEICLGPYGKYMKYKKRNFRIPQKEEYSLEECIGKIY